MNPNFIIWTVSICLPTVYSQSEEQCDIYGAMVNVPGRMCICNQEGVVMCKPRIGGRGLVCIMDISGMGAHVKDVYARIAERKKSFREWIFGTKGGAKKEEEAKVNPNFDPPDFTMTERAPIPGGIVAADEGMGMGMEKEEEQEVNYDYGNEGVGAGDDYIDAAKEEVYEEYEDSVKYRNLIRNPKRLKMKRRALSKHNSKPKSHIKRRRLHHSNSTAHVWSINKAFRKRSAHKRAYKKIQPRSLKFKNEQPSEKIQVHRPSKN